MEATEFKLEYAVCDEPEEKFPVIIVAAGRSERMQGIDKQLMLLCGIPVIARSLMCFENSAYISRIILVTRGEIIPEVQNLAEKYNIKKLSDIVEGGQDRHGSVMNGFSRLTADEKKVLIHDGARPLVSENVIEDAATALYDNDASLPAVPITDTVKLSTDGKFVEKTLDRTALFAAQTPQGVDVSLYLKALENAGNDCEFTDDASVMESAGYKVKLTFGSKNNIKITTRDDILLAEAILRGE